MQSTPIQRHAELAEFLATRAIRFGAFTLASGATSGVYCDGKMATLDPVGVRLVADAILDELTGEDVAAIGGLELGAVPIVAAVALQSGLRGQPLSAFVVRKETKGHGTRKRIEGPKPPAHARVAIVDDVVTKGGSILQAIEAAREAGYEVVIALSVLDREEGGAEAVRKAGVRFRPLVRMSEIRASAGPINTQASGTRGPQ